MELVWLDEGGRITLSHAHVRHLGAVDGSWLAAEIRADGAFVLRWLASGAESDRPAQEPDGDQRLGAGSAHKHTLGQHGLELVPAGQDDDVGSSAGHQPAAVLEPEIRRG